MKLSFDQTNLNRLVSCFLFLLLTGCGMSSSGTHTMSTDQDWFEEEINDRRIECRNWMISIDEKIKIPIDKKKSVIRVEVSAAGEVDIFVNDEQVHDE